MDVAVRRALETALRQLELRCTQMVQVVAPKYGKMVHDTVADVRDDS